ncbi:MAG: hypothetical protein ABWX82_15175 [Leifsonia sp.]
MSTTEPSGAAKPADEPTPTTDTTDVTDATVDESAPSVEPAAPVAAEPVAEPVVVEPVTAVHDEPVIETAPDAAVVATPAEEPVYTAPVVDDSPYVASSTIAEPTAAPATATYDEAYVAPAPNDAYPTATQTPIYVQAPTPPVNKGNRGFGILVGLIATAVFAIIYSIVALVVAGVLTGGNAATAFQEFAGKPVFYVPIIAFFAAFALLAAIINRAGWWAWVVGAFAGAVLVYFSYIGASLLTVQAWTLSFDEATSFLSNRWLDPLAIGAAVIAREVPIWFGAWIAARGRKVSERNVAARQEYDRVLAEGPTISR